MTLNINITINADAEGAFTSHEQGVLQALAGNSAAAPAPAPAAVVTPAPAAEVKVEPKPRVTRKPKPEPTGPAVLEDEGEAEAPAEEVAEAPAEEVAEAPAPKRRAPAKAEPAEAALTTRDAIAAAAPLISEGAAGRAQVKAALDAVDGAKKVSDLKSHAAVAAFLEALGA